MSSSILFNLAFNISFSFPFVISSFVSFSILSKNSVSTSIKGSVKESLFYSFYINDIIFLFIFKLHNKIIPLDLSVGSFVDTIVALVPMLLNSSNDIVAFFDFLPDFLFCSCSFSFFATLTNCSSYANFDNRMAWCNSCSNVSSTALG